MRQLDLNCDMGESTHLHHYEVGNDLHIIPSLSSINIACGFHAGDAQTMQVLVDAAWQHNVAIGAHPSYADRDHFGRQAKDLSEDDIYRLVKEQVATITALLPVTNKRLHHVKPHGALYNAAASDLQTSRAICRAIASSDPGIMLYGLSGSCLKQAADEYELRFVSEVFADRSYQDDGSLTPRNLPGALITDPDSCRQQLQEMAIHGRVKTCSGKFIYLEVETICLHSDGKDAPGFALLIKEFLGAQNITINYP